MLLTVKSDLTSAELSFCPLNVSQAKSIAFVDGCSRARYVCAACVCVQPAHWMLC